MQIDERIERHVREALAAAVGEERDRFEAALDGLSDEDGPTAWQYAAFAVGYVINDIEAADDDLGGIADRTVAATKGWIDIGGKDQVRALLKAASVGDANLPGVPPEKVVNMTFVVASYLLQAYRADDEEWWDYLSTVWEAAAATPETAG
jgi:hypothetical protein